MYTRQCAASYLRSTLAPCVTRILDGRVVAEAVCAFEAKMQGALENMYTNMGDETFKEMRRILPVTGSKYDWSGNAMRMALNRGKAK